MGKVESRLFKDSPIELERIMDSIEGGVELCQYDEDFTIVYVNHGFTKITGYNREEISNLLMGKHSAMMITQDKEWLTKHIKKQIEEKNHFTIEYQIKTKQGKNIWILDKGVLVKTHDNRTMIQCIITDITTQKEQEQALAISEKRYEIAMSFSNVTIFDYNLITKQMIHHQSDIDEYHLPKIMENGVEAMISSGVIQPVSIEVFRAMYKKIEDGDPFVQEIIHIMSTEGESRVLEISLTNIFDYNGKAIRAVGVKKNITETLLLQKEKEFGNTLASNRLLTYEADISEDKIIFYDKDWAEQMNLTEVSSFSGLVKFIAEYAVAVEHRALFIKQLTRETIVDSYEAGQRLIIFEYRKRARENDYRWFEKTINVIKNEVTGNISIRCYIADVQDRKEKEQKAMEEQRFYENMRSKSMMVYELNATKDRCLSGYEKWENLFGIEETGNYTAMMRELYTKVLHPEDRDRVEELFSREHVLRVYAEGQNEISYEYRRVNEIGEFIWVCCTMHIFEEPKTGDVKCFAYIENINKEKEKKLQLIYKSEHDLLTGFYNKSTVEERISDFLDTSEAKIGKHAFLTIDIDYFKSINDTFGHAFGDAVLSQTANRIKQIFRENDILGRIGGDEFAILIKNILNERIAVSKAKEICKCATEIYNQNGISYKISASVGIAFYQEHGKTYEELYKHSDSALYTAKENGRNQFSVYNEKMNIVHGRAKKINQSEIFEVKNFEKNMSGYVLRILYETVNKDDAINSVLALIGKYYDVSRAYIFEDSRDGNNINNTFEWCNTGIIPQIEELQNISQNSMGDYRDYFNEEGIFYIHDVENTDAEVRKMVKHRDVKSIVQLSIIKEGKIIGFVGFDECKFVRVPTKEELSELRNISNILGIFVMEIRASKNSKNMENVAMSIVNGLDAYAYVCDPQSNKILFINEKTKVLAPNARIGEYCHEAFWNRNIPCEQCPVKKLEESKKRKNTVELYNSNFGAWVKSTASWIDWLEGQKVCLIESIDISEYKDKTLA